MLKSLAKFIPEKASLPWMLKKRVLPQHTDHAGVMWHGSYIGWLEEARVETLAIVGLDYNELTAIGFEIPVVSLTIKYKDYLRHGDEVLLENFALKQDGVRWLWKTNFLGDGLKLFAEAKVELVVVRKIDEDYRIVRELPDFLQEAIDKINLGPII